MAIFKCKMCGGTIEFNEGDTIGVCDSCGTKQTLPRLDSDRKTNLYDRANHFRRNNEFDKAMSIYESILNEDPTDAEAYWSIVLCRYGIEYVEDPATHRRVPTVNRAQFTSIFDDEDYKSALKNADALQRSIYEDEAKTINEIQKGILEISAKEEPFDVFICYKETDANGRRTPDSVLATDLYHQLTNEGFKVFFSRITLEDKLGTAYEPYIFAALNSAKAMVVLGTKPEHFNAVWVKNEWSRYLALIKTGAKKTLIPAYRDMDPYDLPEEFSHLQAQDMSKLGFMQDLIRGIKKIVRTDEPKPTTIRETVVQQAAQTNTAPLLRRAFMFLEDSNWQSADEYCEKVLDLDPENAEAYLGKLMAELHVRGRDNLKNKPFPFDNRNNYQKAIRFGDDALKKKLMNDVAFINDRNETERKEEIYQNALAEMREETEQGYQKAEELLSGIPGYKDADVLKAQCPDLAETTRKEGIYQSALAEMRKEKEQSYRNAAELFGSIPDHRDAADKRRECDELVEGIRKDGIYREAVSLMQEVTRAQNEGADITENKVISRYQSAIEKLQNISGWRDADAQIATCKQRIEEITRKRQEIERKCTEAIDDMNRQISDAEKEKQSCQTELSNLKGLFTGGRRKELNARIEECDTTITKCKTRLYQMKCYSKARNFYMAGEYKDAIALFMASKGYSDSASYLKKSWDQVAVRKTIAVGKAHTVGLRADGTVVATGSNKSGQCDVSNWTDIVEITAGNVHTVGLRLDGTVVATKYTGDQEYYCGQCEVFGWTDIVAIAAGAVHTVGLRLDGTVVASKDGDQNHDYGQCNVSDWTDIVAIAAGNLHTVGLKSDGTVVASKDRNQKRYRGHCDVSGWTDIVAIAAGEWHTIGLKSDGTIVATGHNGYGQCDVSGWTDIVAIAAGNNHTVGLKSDGTVVATGWNYCGQCDVSGWTDIVAIAACVCFGASFTVGLKSDGTVVAVGDNHNGQCSISDWNNIKLPER